MEKRQGGTKPIQYRFHSNERGASTASSLSIEQELLHRGGKITIVITTSLSVTLRIRYVNYHQSIKMMACKQVATYGLVYRGNLYSIQYE